MKTQIKKRTARRVRIAAATLGAALLLPGLAIASPYDCTSACPAVNANLVVGAAPTTTNTASSLTYIFNAHDGSAATPKVDHLLPKGWRFAFQSTRPANDDPTTTDCTSIWGGSSAPRRLASAEGIGTADMRVAIHSPNPTTDPVDGTYDYGRTDGGKGFASFGFLSYDATAGVAHACLDFYSDSAANATDATGFLASDLSNAPEFLLPVTITALPSTSAYGWDFSIDLSPFYKDATMNEYQASILSLSVIMSSASSGNWNRDQNGKLKAVNPFSETPATPATTPVAATFTACNGHVDPTTTSGCANDATTPVTVTATSLVIQDPPTAQGIHPFGVFTSMGIPDGGSGVAGVLAAGNSLVRGSDAVKISWQQPPAISPQDTIRGYVIAIAHPGDKSSEYFKYMITQPIEVDASNNLTGTPTPGFDPSICGSDGTAPTCSTTITFPQVGIGGTILTGDDKYNLVLITLYADGHRSDGYFDPHDATTGEALCPGGTDVVSCGDGIVDPSQPKFNISGTGRSYWQLLITPTAYTNAYVELDVYSPTGGGPDATLPKFVLLVDWAKRTGEFVNYQPLLSVPAVFYRSSSSLIQSQDNATGSIVFGNLSAVGAKKTWEFAGSVLGAGGAALPCAQMDPGNSNDSFDVFDVCGYFVTFDPKNPSLNSVPVSPSTDPMQLLQQLLTISGTPEANVYPFEGVAV